MNSSEHRHIVMSTSGVFLSTFVFWFTVYLAIHFYNSTESPMKDMAKPERFVMELLSSSAIAITIMFILGMIDMAFKS